MNAKKRKKLKLPKPRIPTPPSDRTHPDRRKETDRTACRKKIEENRA